ncbi:MAG: spondin domain-containing protein, partial [Thermoanaerobaculia bacterium]
GAVALALQLAFTAATYSQTGTATYEVVFHSTWSAATHPGAFPDGGHFSPLIGGVHDESVRFWRSGDLASSGIEQMAERGRTSPLDRHVEDAIEAGTAREVIRGGPLPQSPGSVSTTFTVSREHPLVSLVTMVAPSPDWFVGVRDLSLLENDEWIEDTTVALLGYDAGSDDGEDFTSADLDPSPHHPISRLTSGPFTGVPGNTPFGTFTFRRIAPEGGGEEHPLFLSGGRFRVDATWADYAGRSGIAHGQSFTDETGYFWFFSTDNVEVTIKVVDGCSANGHFWIYASGLTDVEVALAVTDLETDDVYEIGNALGHPFDLVRDDRAFASCP